MHTIVISALHDPDAIFPKLTNKVQSDLKQISKQGLVVACSSATDLKTIELLGKLGMIIESGDSWGLARINVLKKALEKDFDYLVFIDFDKLIHWLMVDRNELFNYLDCNETSDFLIGCRTDACWKTYPKSWRETETNANQAYSKLFGFNVDILVAQSKMTKKTAEIINREAKETGWASNGEWPFIAWKNHLKIGCREFNGLTWENPDRLSISLEEIREKYNSREEWAKRRKNAEDIKNILRKLK